MPFKLLALDLDGTVLPTRGNISIAVKAAIDAAQEHGVRVTLASGRTFSSTAGFAQELGIRNPLICHQGALIKDPVTQHVLHEDLVPAAAMREIVLHARQHQLHLNIYLDDETYMERSAAELELYAQLSRVRHQAVPDLMTLLDRDPTKCIWVSESPEHSDALLPVLQATFGDRLSVVRSHPYLIEGVTLAASKGHALATLAHYFGISREETAAIGDSDNDSDMVAWAGLGLAMGNATRRVMDVADCVLPSIAEDGAAWGIEQYILAGQVCRGRA